MNPWLTLSAFLLVALVLGLIGYHFSLRALRLVTALACLGAAIGITSYGLTHPAQAHGTLFGAFTGGANAVSVALLHAEPGSTGWIIIAVALVIGYRELEVWTLHFQARSLDTSALTADRTDSQPGETSGDDEDAKSDKEHYDRLVAELKFRLPAVEVRSPAIFPGGSRAGGLASIAEASGLPSGGLAGAIINFFGMLWPSPRRLRVRVWLERIPDDADKVTMVTVHLDDPRTGLSIATKTLAAPGIDEAASAVAGYVARHIFAEDRTAPPWCTGAADGGDLAALLIAREVRGYPESAERISNARKKQIRILKPVATGPQCAGVARYELAQLCNLAGQHVEALLLHAINREQYPHFYRSRYRLAMSLEMIANPELDMTISADDVPRFNKALEILWRCGALKAGQYIVCQVGRDKDGEAGDDAARVPLELQAELLDVARGELHAIQRYLSLPSVLWRSLWHRDERGILKPYLRQRHRQAFHDGIAAAELLVAVRRASVSEKMRCPAADLPHRVGVTLRIAAAITGDAAPLASALGIGGVKPLENGAPPLTKSLRTRHWFRRDCTRSWQAGYNLACAYAAIAQSHQAAGADHNDLGELIAQVVSCLEFTVCNPECEIERPWEWFVNDPDFGWERLRNELSFLDFWEFLAAQRRGDFPSVPMPRADRGNGRRSYRPGQSVSS
jgi:hypothetical protein